MTVSGRLVALLLPICLLAQRSGRAAYEPSAQKAAPEQNPFLASAVRQAAAAVFLAEVKALQSLASRVRAYEKQNAEALGGFRLSDNLAELAAGLAPTRSERLEQMEMVAREADETVRDRLARCRRDDPLVQAQRLQWRRLWNRLAGVVNYVTESAAGLANGNSQVLLKWTADLLFSWRSPLGPSAWERKQRVLYQQFQERYPDDPEAPNARAAFEKLNRKVQKESTQEILRLSKLQREAGHPDEALFYAEKAAQAGANADRANLKATQSQRQPQRDQIKTLAIAGPGESQAEPSEAPKLRSLLARLVAGDAEGLAREAESFLRAHPQSPFRDEAQYLRAVAADLNGNRQEAQRIRAALASEGGAENMAVHARNAQASAHADPEAAYKLAQSQADRDTWRYILFGFPPPAERLRMANDGEYRSRGVFDYLSAVLVIDSLIRGLKAAFGAGPTNEVLRDAAGAWIRKEPENPRAKELSVWLGAQAERRGAYAQALPYYEQAKAATTEKRAELRKKEARDLYARAEQVENPAARQAILEQASRELADTKYGQKAGTKALEAEKEQRIVLDKRSLAALPELWDGRGLGWDRALFDGRPENGELAEAGATFFPPDQREVQFTVIENGQEKTRRIRLEGRAYEEARAALKERELLAARREAAQEYERRRLVPLEIQGSVGGEGLLVYPTLLPYRMDAQEQQLYK